MQESSCGWGWTNAHVKRPLPKTPWQVENDSAAISVPHTPHTGGRGSGSSAQTSAAKLQWPTETGRHATTWSAHWMTSLQRIWDKEGGVLESRAVTMTGFGSDMDTRLPPALQVAHFASFIYFAVRHPECLSGMCVKPHRDTEFMNRGHIVNPICHA